jgi:adenine-specific DNA methylase
MARRRVGQTSFPTVHTSELALKEGNAKKPVYAMHKWWARRLGTVFRMLLIWSTSDDDADEEAVSGRFYHSVALPDGFTVLDPFMGGGTSLIETAKLGGRCIGVDIDPVACFVAEMELSRVDHNAVRSRFSQVETKVAEKILSLYRSKVEGEVVDVVYFFWVDRVTCTGCRGTTDAHPTYLLAEFPEHDRRIVLCPECGALAETRRDARGAARCDKCCRALEPRQAPVRLGRFSCPRCGEVHRLPALHRAGAVTQHLFALEYMTKDGQRGFAPATAADRALFKRAADEWDKIGGSLPVPDARIPSAGRSDSRPLLYGYQRYQEMFNPRQLLCLGTIAAEIRRTRDIEVRKALALAFSHCVASNNMFCSYAFGYRRLAPLFSVHSFRKISRPVEGNVWGLREGRGTFRNAVRAVLAGQEYMRHPFEYRYRHESRPLRVPIGLAGKGASGYSARILNQSSANLSSIPSGSIDLILTDPPYFDNLSYSELSDFYHVWLREVLGSHYLGHRLAHTPLGESLYGGWREGDGEGAAGTDRFQETLAQVFRECWRVAKDRMVFTYHHQSPDAWRCLAQALLAADFDVMDVFPVRSEGRSGLHNYSGTIKWDSVLVCRKRRKQRRTTLDGRSISAALRAARAGATAWGRQLAAAGLDFRPVDESSLRMALVVREFSRRGVGAAGLAAALDRAAGMR